MKILGINGSSPYDTKGEHRPYGGSTLALLNKVLGAAKTEGWFLKVAVETEVVHLHEVMQEFYPGNYDHLPEWIVPTFRLMMQADALVFASPVQWYAMSDYMKSFINHLTALEGGDEDIGEYFPGITLKEGRQLSGKAAAVIATCHHDGAAHTILSMTAPLNDMGVLIVPAGASYYNNKNWKLEEGDEDGDWQNEDFARVGQNLVRMVCIHAGMQIDHNNWLIRN